jgi:hypothetical protein
LRVYRLAMAGEVGGGGLMRWSWSGPIKPTPIALSQAVVAGPETEAAHAASLRRGISNQQTNVSRPRRAAALPSSGCVVSAASLLQEPAVACACAFRQRVVYPRPLVPATIGGYEKYSDNEQQTNTDVPLSPMSLLFRTASGHVRCPSLGPHDLGWFLFLVTGRRHS